MTAIHRMWSAVTLCVVLGLLPGRFAEAANREDEARSKELVREALHAEIDGRQRDRTLLLQEALQAAPETAAARWHAGYVQWKGQWVAADKVPALAAQDERLPAYLHQRDKAEDTVEGHLRLASYCRSKGLAEQERAHLSRVTDLSPDHAEARRKLGFRKIGSRWVSSEEWDREQAHAAAIAAGLEKWQPTVDLIVKGWANDSLLKQKAARAKLAEINDPAAIPALENSLSILSEGAALMVVEKLEGWPDGEATLSLARHAVLSPWDTVRRAATKALGQRPLEEYAPLLLSEMYNPVVSNLELGNVGGRLLYRQSFLREGQQRTDAMVFHVAYRREALPGGDAADTFSRAMVGMAMSTLQRDQQVVAQNAFTQALNERIAEVLAATTGKKLAATPNLWWQWWSDQQEIVQVGPKPLDVQNRYQEIILVDRVTAPMLTSAPSISGVTVPGQPSHECLVAGTRVWTAAGPVAIEKLRVGDLVLSQHPLTGELAYKPVVRTTVRPPEKLVRVKTASETFECTGGHPFWVAGQGWLKARSLPSGSELHGAAGTSRVSEVVEGGTAETFNLIVGDFHTYFLGDRRVLTHDNSPRRPTLGPVPGLIDR